MRITITPLPAEFEQEDDFTEFIATQFPVGAQVRVSSADKMVLWDGTVTEIEKDD